MGLYAKYAKDTTPAYCGTIEYVNKPLSYIYFYMMISMIIIRCKYYSGWKMTQASVILTGLSYEYKKSENKKQEITQDFYRIESCSVYHIEFNHNIRTRIQYWNRTVHLWLKYYVYMRLISIKSKTFFNNKALASLLTFMVSACWHGFYPVYYFFFLQFYFAEQIGTVLEEKWDFFNWISKKNKILQIIYWNFISSELQFIGHVFIIKTYYEVYNFYRAFYYIPAFILVLFYLLIVYIIPYPKKEKIEKKKE